jgi:hypothetical protein
MHPSTSDDFLGSEPETLTHILHFISTSGFKTNRRLCFIHLLEDDKYRTAIFLPRDVMYEILPFEAIFIELSRMNHLK